MPLSTRIFHIFFSLPSLRNILAPFFFYHSIHTYFPHCFLFRCTEPIGFISDQLVSFDRSIIAGKEVVQRVSMLPGKRETNEKKVHLSQCPFLFATPIIYTILYPRFSHSVTNYHTVHLTPQLCSSNYCRGTLFYLVSGVRASRLALSRDFVIFSGHVLDMHEL